MILAQCRATTGWSIEAAVSSASYPFVEAAIRCLNHANYPVTWLGPSHACCKESAAGYVLEQQGGMAPAAMCQPSQLTSWEQLQLAMPAKRGTAEAAGWVAAAASNTCAPAVSSAAVQPFHSSRSRPPHLFASPMAPGFPAQSGMVSFGTASAPLRYTDAIAQCSQLNELVNVWRRAERELRVHHWALLSLRAAVLRREQKTAGMSSQRAQNVVHLIQASAMRAIQLDVCSVVDLQRLLLAWRISHYTPPPPVLCTVLALLRPPPPQPAAATGGYLDAAYKLRSADGDGLACISSSLLHFNLLGPHDMQLVAAVAAAAGRRACECSFKSLAQLAHVLSACSWGDAAAHCELATAALKRMHGASAADIAWLLHTLTQPATLPKLPYLLMDTLLRSAADAYMMHLAAMPTTAALGTAHQPWVAGARFGEEPHSGARQAQGGAGGGAVHEPVLHIARILNAFSRAGAQHELLLEACAAAAVDAADRLSLRQIMDIAAALRHLGLSHDPLHLALIRRINAAARALQVHRPGVSRHVAVHAAPQQAASEPHLGKSGGSKVPQHSTHNGGGTWEVEDFAGLPGVDVPMQQLRQGPEAGQDSTGNFILHTTPSRAAPTPQHVRRRNSSSTAADEAWARSQLEAVVRQAGGARAAVPSSPGAAAAHTNASCSSTTIHKLLELLQAACAVAGEGGGHGQLERMRMVGTVLDAVYHALPQPHLEPAAWPVVGAVAELCTTSRHVDEWALYACARTLEAVVQGGAQRPDQSHTPGPHLSGLGAVRLSLSLMHCMTLFSTCVMDTRTAEATTSAMRGPSAAATYQLWGTHLTSMEPAQMCQMLRAVWLLGDWPWQQLLAPILRRLGASVEAAAQQAGTTTFLDHTSASTQRSSSSVVSSALRAVKSLSHLVTWRGVRAAASGGAAHAQLGTGAPSQSGGQQVELRAAAERSADGPGVVSCVEGDEGVQGMPWYPSLSELEIVHEIMHCAVQRVGFTGTASTAALGNHASSPAFLRAATHAWAAAQPRMPPNQIKALVNMLGALGLKPVTKRIVLEGGMAQMHVCVGAQVGGAVFTDNRVTPPATFTDTPPPLVTVEVLPPAFSPTNAPLQLLATAAARARRLRAASQPLLHAAISAGEWELSGATSGNTASYQAGLHSGGATHVHWLSRREHLLQKRVASAQRCL